MTPPSIRPATLADLPALHALVERAYRGDAARAGWTHEADLLDGQRIDLAALGEIVADPRQSLLIAFADGALVGCVQVTQKDGALCYLGLLSVEPKLQAAGLGKRLIDVAEREAASRFGADAMEMTVIRQRGELVAYYVRRGYALTGEERPFPLDDERFGLPRTRDLAFVVLRKPLESSPEES
jgi:ribosomal protein S18 acetylase RimI-like enzyme